MVKILEGKKCDQKDICEDFLKIQLQIVILEIEKSCFFINDELVKNEQKIRIKNYSFLYYLHGNFRNMISDISKILSFL